MEWGGLSLTFSTRKHPRLLDSKPVTVKTESRCCLSLNSSPTQGMGHTRDEKELHSRGCDGNTLLETHHRWILGLFASQRAHFTGNWEMDPAGNVVWSLLQLA